MQSTTVLRAAVFALLTKNRMGVERHPIWAIVVSALAKFTGVYASSREKLPLQWQAFQEREREKLPLQWQYFPMNCIFGRKRRNMTSLTADPSNIARKRDAAIWIPPSQRGAGQSCLEKKQVDAGYVPSIVRANLPNHYLVSLVNRICALLSPSNYGWSEDRGFFRYVLSFFSII